MSERFTEGRILTFTGKWVDPMDLQLEDINIEDIAHGCALENRWANQTICPINSAQHSVYVARIVSYLFPGDFSLTLQALLHDATDAYMGDIPKYVKESKRFTWFVELEEENQRTIYRKFNCNLEMHPVVKDADRLMAALEGQVGHLTNWHPPPGYVLTPKQRNMIGSWQPWTWEESKENFLEAFHWLKGK